jgi:hypothetical protein
MGDVIRHVTMSLEGFIAGPDCAKPKVIVQVSIIEIRPKAKMRVGLEWGFKSQFDALDRHLGH